MLRIILSALLIIGVSFAADALEKSGGTIIDIGSPDEAAVTEVAPEWRYYDGPIIPIELSYLFEERVYRTESCITDALGRENCPIGAVQCPSNREEYSGEIGSWKNGRKMVNSICPNGYTYNSSSKFCEKSVTTTSARGYPFWVGEQQKRTCKSSPKWSAVESFTISAPSRVTFKVNKGSEGSAHATVALRLQVKKDGIFLKNWDMKVSDLEHDPVIGFITLEEAGKYNLDAVAGAFSAGGNRRCSVTSPAAIAETTTSSNGRGFGFYVEPNNSGCPEGGYFGQAVLGQNPDLCYVASIDKQPTVCPSGYVKTTPDPNCSQGGAFDAYHCSPQAGSDIGPLECKRDYSYPVYACDKTETNEYAYKWNGPILPESDCKANCGNDKCKCDNSPPADNCYRGNFNCPVDPNQRCTKTVAGSECPEGESVTEIQYRLLDVKEFSGELRANEYGRKGDYVCGDNCGMNIQWIQGSGNRLCVGNGLGESTCFSSPRCTFSGRIDATEKRISEEIARENGLVDENNLTKYNPKGIYLSGFRVGSDRKTISGATRSWRFYNELNPKEYNDYIETIDGVIQSSCEIIGAVGNFTRNGGITAAKAAGSRIQFWDSYKDGAVGSIELVPQIPETDRQDGFDYINSSSYRLLEMGFSALFEDGTYTWAISGKPISKAECLKTEEFGFYQNTTSAYAMSLVPNRDDVNNWANGKSWCLVASDLSDFGFYRQKLSVRRLVHDACDDKTNMIYDATPMCHEGGAFNQNADKCGRQDTQTYDAQKYCANGMTLSADGSKCLELVAQKTAPIKSCSQGDLSSKGCEFVEEENATARGPFCVEQNMQQAYEGYVGHTGPTVSGNQCVGTVTTQSEVNVICPTGSTYDASLRYCKHTTSATEAKKIRVPSSICSENNTRFYNRADEITYGWSNATYLSSGYLAFQEYMDSSSGAYGYCQTQGGYWNGGGMWRHSDSSDRNIYFFCKSDGPESDPDIYYAKCIIPAKCPAGFSVSGSSCIATPTCPSGYSRVSGTGTCRKSVTESYAYPVAYSCDKIKYEGETDYVIPEQGESWTLIGDQCRANFDAIVDPVLSCGAGYAILDDMCVKYTTNSHPLSYKCQDADSISNKTCTRKTTTYYPAEWVCGDGGNPVDRKCEKDPSPVAHFCSPNSCNELHVCKTADCKEGFDGDVLSKDMKPSDPRTCVKQTCDAWKPFYDYCGYITGCKGVEYDDGYGVRCYEMSCGEGEFVPDLERCRKFGCPPYSVEKENKCYR
jgi:hypothetical protein